MINVFHYEATIDLTKIFEQIFIIFGDLIKCVLFLSDWKWGQKTKGLTSSAVYEHGRKGSKKAKAASN